MNYWRINISRKNAYDIYIKEKEFEKLNSFLLIGESVIDRWDPSVELYFKRGGGLTILMYFFLMKIFLSLTKIQR